MNSRAAAMAALLVLLVIGVVAVLAVAPPDARQADTPESEFSAARASAHLAEIAQRPHPPGTDDHARVRDYIVDTAKSFGVMAQVQTGHVVRAADGGPFPSARVQNIVARAGGPPTTWCSCSPTPRSSGCLARRSSCTPTT
jgi:hypothetical protein